MNFILPHSIYARGYHDDKNGGMTFEELAKVMQARMKAQGIENREYTQGILFQKYYQTMARAGKKRATGPHIKLSKQKLEKVKELRAWLDRNRVGKFFRPSLHHHLKSPMLFTLYCYYSKSSRVLWLLRLLSEKEQT